MPVLRRRCLGGKFRDIANQLGITEMAAKRAAQLGRKMEKALLTDPYVPLSEPPANAARWRPHGKDGDREASYRPPDAA